MFKIGGCHGKKGDRNPFHGSFLYLQLGDRPIYPGHSPGVGWI
ncbi:hypothetical protein [Oxynema aestuarii]|nr:hypothetical protein [Oxynema aestuarii]